MPSGARLAITLFALLAFTIQSYVTQVHIHGTARIGGATLALDKSATQQQSPGKAPPGDDPANCPICQQILHAGSFVAPSAAAFVPLTLTASIVAIVIEIATLAQAYSHSWRSRAPPQI